MKVKYHGLEYFVICNNYNGTLDLALNEVKSWVGENCWVGVKRAVEKDECVAL